MSRSPLFRLSVDKLLGTFRALTVAVQHGQGGPSGKEISLWMRTVVEDFFYQNDDLSPEEVGEFVGEIMNQELDTLVEDGSLTELGAALCTHFRLQNDEAHLLKLHADLDKQLAEQQPLPPVADEEGSSSEDEEDEEMETEESGPPQASGHKSGHQFVSEPDEEGWATVCSSKSKKK